MVFDCLVYTSRNVHTRACMLSLSLCLSRTFTVFHLTFNELRNNNTDSKSVRYVKHMLNFFLQLLFATFLLQ